MSRRVYTSPDGDGPDVSAWAVDGHENTAVGVHHRTPCGPSSVSLVNYLSRPAARELARNLLAACDAIDMDEARQRNLTLALPPVGATQGDTTAVKGGGE